MIKITGPIILDTLELNDKRKFLLFSDFHESTNGMCKKSFSVEAFLDYFSMEYSLKIDHFIEMDNPSRYIKSKILDRIKENPIEKNVEMLFNEKYLSGSSRSPEGDLSSNIFVHWFDIRNDKKINEICYSIFEVKKIFKDIEIDVFEIKKITGNRRELISSVKKKISSLIKRISFSKLLNKLKKNSEEEDDTLLSLFTRSIGKVSSQNFENYLLFFDNVFENDILSTLISNTLSEILLDFEDLIFKFQNRLIELNLLMRLEMKYSHRPNYNFPIIPQIISIYAGRSHISSIKKYYFWKGGVSDHSTFSKEGGIFYGLDKNGFIHNPDKIKNSRCLKVSSDYLDYFFRK